MELSPVEAFFAASMGIRPNINLSVLLPPQYACLANVIERCWHASSEARPSAQEIVSALLGIKQQMERAEKESSSSPPQPVVRPAPGAGHASRIGMTGTMLQGASTAP